MDNKPLIKWHAQKLIDLLTQEDFTFVLAKMVVELEKLFFKSEKYKDIELLQPDQHL